jgi:membrane protein YqaA with SNARE-associated domain
MDAPATPHGWRSRLTALSYSRHGTRLLAAVAFADSSFLPIPPDLLLVPMSLMRPERMRALIVICIIASSLGAVVGYLIGWGLWGTIGVRLVEFYDCAESFAAYQRLVEQWGVAIIVVKAFTPIPFKIAAIAAGVASMNPLSFILAAIFGRALHFAMVGGLIVLFGARITALIARYERPLAFASAVALIGIAAVFYLR